MDFNQLYFDHQIAVIRADSALSDPLRRESAFDASVIAGRIGCMQRALGAGAARGWEALAAADVAQLTSRLLALLAPNRSDALSPTQT